VIPSALLLAGPGVVWLESPLLQEKEPPGLASRGIERRATIKKLFYSREIPTDTRNSRYEMVLWLK
jgi:hypothetical protein